MSYLYTPPEWQNVRAFPGAWALRFSIPTSTCVYRRGGVWVNVLSPGPDDVEDIDIDDSGLTLFFQTPTVVPDSLYGELAAVQKADPSWSDPTLTAV